MPTLEFTRKQKKEEVCSEVNQKTIEGKDEENGAEVTTEKSVSSRKYSQKSARATQRKKKP